MKTIGLLGLLGPIGTGEIIFILFAALFFAGFAFLNGKIAQWKGYPFWAGALSGFIHIFGTILFLILPLNKGVVKQANTKQCPYCGEEILEVARKCKHCSEWLDNK